MICGMKYLPSGPGVVDEIQPDLGGHVGEPRRASRRVVDRRPQLPPQQATQRRQDHTGGDAEQVFHARSRLIICLKGATVFVPVLRNRARRPPGAQQAFPVQVGRLTDGQHREGDAHACDTERTPAEVDHFFFLPKYPNTLLAKRSDRPKVRLTRE